MTHFYSNVQEVTASSKTYTNRGIDRIAFKKPVHAEPSRAWIIRTHCQTGIGCSMKPVQGMLMKTVRCWSPAPTGDSHGMEKVTSNFHRLHRKRFSGSFSSGKRMLKKQMLLTRMYRSGRCTSGGRLAALYFWLLEPGSLVCLDPFLGFLRSVVEKFRNKETGLIRRLALVCHRQRL